MAKRDRDHIRGVAVTLVYLHVALLLVVAIAMDKSPQYRWWFIVVGMTAAICSLTTLFLGRAR